MEQPNLMKFKKSKGNEILSNQENIKLSNMIGVEEGPIVFLCI